MQHVTLRVAMLMGLLTVCAQCASTRTVRQPSSSSTCPTIPEDVVKVGDPGIVGPVLVQQVFARTTADAMRRKVNGSVYVRALVDRVGTVTAVCVTRSLDPGLDEEALKALKQWTFRPATRSGEPVVAAVVVEMAFATR